MKPDWWELLVQLNERAVKLGSPLLQPGLERLIPGDSSEKGPGAAPAAGASSLLDHLRSQQLIVEETMRIHALLLRLLTGPWTASTPPPPAAESRAATEPEPDPSPAEASMIDALKQMERLLMLHPLAAQAAFSALVAEGRRFASTPRGEELASSLSKAPLLANLRRVWEATTLNMLEEQPTTVVPSMYVEAIFRAAKSANLEGLLTAQRPRRSPA